LTYAQNLLQSKPLYRPEAQRARMTSYAAGAGSSISRSLKGQWPLYLLILLPIATLYALTASEVLPFDRKGFIAALLGCVSLGFALVNPQAALILIMLTVGLSPEFTSENVGNLRFEDFMIPSLFAIWLFRQMGSREKFTPVPVRTPILLFLLIAAISSLYNVGFQGLDGKTAGMIYFKYVEYLLLLVMTANLIRTERQLAVMLGVFLVSGLLSAFYGMYQRALGLDAYGGRVTGPDGETANIYGGYLIFQLLVGFGLWLECRKPALKMALLAFMAILFYVVLRTLSRGAFVGLAVAMMLMSVLLGNWRILLGILVFLVLGPIILHSDVSDRLGTIVHVLPGTGHDAPTSWQSKTSTWVALLGDIYRFPLFGQGMGRYPFGWVDNEYVKVTLEVGFVGLLAWAWWILGMWMISRRNFKIAKTWWHKGMACGYACGLTGLAVHAIAATSFTTIRTMETLMIATGMMLAMQAMLERRKRMVRETLGAERARESGRSLRLVKLRRIAGPAPA